jgi:hypothetical protein
MFQANRIMAFMRHLVRFFFIADAVHDLSGSAILIDIGASSKNNCRRAIEYCSHLLAWHGLLHALWQ